ncbi:hypothetical protein ACFVS2_26200 [Brevibacillus sp. NPDC058079]|uniref:hypothetical protein n=1 Tax=Brevibacillus sp. NPDC058079 TaxID=3346330 RepID=UPI0036E6EA86
MSFYDDHYADMVMEETASKEAFEIGLNENEPQAIIDAIMSMFQTKTHFKGDAEKAQAILKTIARTGRVSDKQKRFLFVFLLKNDKAFGDRHDLLVQKCR